MNIKTYLKKILTFSLITVLLITSTACVKRVSILPDTREIKSYMDRIYVHLKPGKAYMGKSVLAVKNPKVEGHYLIGKRRNSKITIPLDDIDSIEIQRFDAKKTLIYSFAFIVGGVIIIHVGRVGPPGFGE